MKNRCISARSSARMSSVRSVRVEAVHGTVEKAQLAAVSFAAAVMLAAPSANAGVIMAQPELKKAFQGESPAPAKAVELIIPKGPGSVPMKSAPQVKEEKKSEPIEFPSLGLDVRSIGLPASIGFVAGLAFLASRLDEEFEDFMSATLIKDSNLGQSGLGYEEVIKGTYGGIYGTPTMGTKKISKKK